MLKRKWLLTGLVALLLILLTSPALAATLRFGTVDGVGSVNLRQSASSQSKRLGVYPEGTWIRITGESGAFYKVVMPDGKSGYIQMDYVAVTSAAMGTIGIVDDAGYLNLRKSASSTAKVLGQYDDGTPCVLLSQKNGYYHVSVDGKLGYFDDDYIRTKYMAYSRDVATVVTSNGGALRMRKGPDTDYSAIRSFKNGTYVMILQKGNGWWKVAADGSIGFMDADFLHDGILRQDELGSGKPGASGNGGSLAGKKYAYVSNPGKNDKLNLRAASSQQSKSLGQYGNGVRVTILNAGPTWCQVKVDGKIGYMMTRYLTADKPTSLPDDDDGGSLSGSKYAYVSNPGRNDKLNLRESASQQSKSLGRYGNGVRVQLLSTGTTWCRVKVDGKTGYMMTKYLSLTKPDTTPDSSLSGSKYAYVSNPRSSDKLRLRAKASQSGKVLGAYSNGTKVTLLEVGAQWCKVKVDGRTGYMMTEFLALKNTSGVPGQRVYHPDGTYVYLRRSASQQSGALTRVPHGETVTVLTPGKYWTKVRYEGYTGYMMTQFLK